MKFYSTFATLLLVIQITCSNACLAVLTNEKILSDTSYPFIAFSQNKKGTTYLNAIISTGELYSIGQINTHQTIEVIHPLIYVFDKKNYLLSIYNSKGLILAQNLECVNYSASSKGILVLDKSNNLNVYILENEEIIKTNEFFSNVNKYKISENVFLVQKNNSPKIETYKFNSNSATFFPITPQGWNEKNNIISASFNKNFFISEDNLTVVNTVNFQGTSIYKGRGNLKAFYLTSNHFIGHYGNGKVEVYNPYSNQVVLTLPLVYSIKASSSFITFRSENNYTVVNDKGEIFPISSEVNLTQGEFTFATFNGNEILIFNSSGKLINKKTTSSVTDIRFFGDFVCGNNDHENGSICFLSSNKDSEYFILRSNYNSDVQGVNNWGMLDFIKENGLLNVYLNNGIKSSYSNILNVYYPVLTRNNDYRPISF